MDNEWVNNTSPVGWYVATELLRFIPDGVDGDDRDRRFLVWENLVLIRADGPETAYQKAVERGESGNVCVASGRWQFEGLKDLLPVYDEPTDGSEILWVEHKAKSAAVVKRMAKDKKQLRVFL